MKIAGREVIEEFKKHHANVRGPLTDWSHTVKYASWKSPQDLKRRYSTAKILPDDIVVFKIKGNHYRLKVEINFELQIVWVKWIGTHAEYSR